MRQGLGHACRPVDRGGWAERKRSRIRGPPTRVDFTLHVPDVVHHEDTSTSRSAPSAANSCPGRGFGDRARSGSKASRCVPESGAGARVAARSCAHVPHRVLIAPSSATHARLTLFVRWKVRGLPDRGSDRSEVKGSMRRLGILSVLALLATWVTVVAVDAGASVLTPTASAQGDPATPQMNYSHVEVPFFEEWIGSGHADLNSEAFIHWNEDDPPVVPARCGQCHSSAGHADYLGLDGTEFGVVDEATEPGVIQCSTCHNEVTLARTTVEMPSGVVLTDLGREASCMTCHQGRANGATVSQAVEEAGVGMVEIMSEQGFINIHYYAAAATLYGSEAGGGFQYEGEYYDPRFEHVEGYDSCQSCHDPHSLELRVESCAECHRGVETVEDLREIRFAGSLVDYDGDGDITTGIATEIDNLQHMLYDAIQAYATDVVGTGVVYDSHAYPYFFTDSDGDGEVDADEANYGNRYGTWTPRLLAAAYNYQATKKDPGGYAHNAKYTIQLLHDSILDLTGAMGDDSMAIVRPTLDASPADENAVLAQASSDYDHGSLLSTLPAMSHGGLAEMIRRNDAGHFDGSTDAWRHWDEDGAVSASCATCHSADGLPFKLEHDT